MFFFLSNVRVSDEPLDIVHIEKTSLIGAIHVVGVRNQAKRNRFSN